MKSILTKNKITSGILGAVLPFFLAGCASTSGSGNSNGNVNNSSARVIPTLQNDCPLQKISWLVVDAKADNEKVASVSRKLSEAALKDADKIKQMATTGNSPLELSSALQSVVDANAGTRLVVSQEFYQEYVSNRSSLCAVLEAVRRGSIKKEESTKSTETAFRKISGSFEKFSQ